ncbi:nucleotide exchange factor GrpE [Deferribacter autotrophicus]|uniref:Protein GrpE n=1 Tax=Deferribacter autotrophicus TaxID=500465 RepID=A0A5A8F4I8_9BACT|nr:nucleotide exchange factor GrpE [Deferribacter autotrophicus]KAA0259054.1 nucleotide exchange factor GrpE [Deferribacter autotrophicus]
MSKKIKINREEELVKDETEQEKKKTSQENIKDKGSKQEEIEKQEDDVLKKLENENKELKKQLQEKEDAILRLSAELDNFRKRLLRETEEKLKYANQVLLESLLPVIDHLEMALSHIKPDSPVESLKQGVDLTLKQMKDILAKFGLKEIELNVGDDFDPNFHEALMLDYKEDFDNNKVTQILQKGYTLNGRVIRPSKVSVNKKEEKNNDNKEDKNE